MKLDRALYQRSHLFFGAFLTCMVAAFWYTYFTRLSAQPNYRMHVHGGALILWCLVLLAQPLLIRAKQFAWHRRIGTFSYLLVPIVVFTTLDLLIFRLAGPKSLATMDYFSVALIVNALIAFLILYGLAILYRKTPLIHARFMVASAFPMVTPITDRILFIFFPALVPYHPTIAGEPIVPVSGFLLADAMLVGLSVWDWVSHRRWHVFPFALLVLVAYHGSVMTFYRFPFWHAFSSWLAGR